MNLLFRLSLAFCATFVACQKPQEKSTLPRADIALQRQLWQKIQAAGNKPYLLKLPEGSPEFPFDVENRLTTAGVELGRWLFYDTVLSEDYSMACASCHQQNRAFTDGKVYSPGVHGENTGFNSMTLVNLAWSKFYFWDGRIRTLRQQVLEPIKNTRELNLAIDGLVARLKSHEIYPQFFRMAFADGQIDDKNIARALAQFMSVLISFDAPLDGVRRVEIGVKKESELSPELASFLLKNMDSETREAVNLCGGCHSGTNLQQGRYVSALYGGTKMTNNGLPDTASKFKVPDLRNNTLTAPYMHDGRFRDIAAVIEHYDSGITENVILDPLLRDDMGSVKRLRLSKRAKANLAHYLSLMTDEAFLNNPAFADPFRRKP